MADYDSTFEVDSESEKRSNDLVIKEPPLKKSKASKDQVLTEYCQEETRRRKQSFLALDVYSRHKLLINEYVLNYSGSTSKLKRNTVNDKNDFDVLRENHKFLWDEEEDPESWEKRLAKKYYDKLYKEYCISDLSRYKENKIAMRWRIKDEVLSGKGQFICGEKRCTEAEGLKSWEVNFAYNEDGVKKNALVKLRLCSDCSYKLNYRHKRKEIKKKNKRKEVVFEESKQSVPPERPAQNNEHETSGHDDEKQESANGKCDQKKEDDDKEELWKEPIQEGDEEKSINEEFDDYLEDLLQ